MDVAGKSLQRRVGIALAVFAVLVAYDYTTGSAVDWTVNLLVPPMFFLFSLLVDTVMQNWLDGDR